jgi:hypothetical protein
MGLDESWKPAGPVSSTSGSRGRNPKPIDVYARATGRMGTYFSHRLAPKVSDIEAKRRRDRKDVAIA